MNSALQGLIIVLFDSTPMKMKTKTTENKRQEVKGVSKKRLYKEEIHKKDTDKKDRFVSFYRYNIICVMPWVHMYICMHTQYRFKT